MRPPIVSAVDCVSYLSANRTKARAFFAAIGITEVAIMDAVVVPGRRKGDAAVRPLRDAQVRCHFS
jgi:hypothetical protein